MLISDLSSEQLLLMILPAIPNLWALRHAMYHDFDDPRVKTRWMLACVFVPCLGGLAYYAIGRKHARGAVDPLNRAQGGDVAAAVPPAEPGKNEPSSLDQEGGAPLRRDEEREWSFACPDDEKKGKQENV